MPDNERSPSEKWSCKQCGTLLGEVENSELHIRYRQDVQLLVEGRDFRLTRACRKCGTLNVWRTVEVEQKTR
jgi:RNase P subunit RPR2